MRRRHPLRGLLPLRRHALLQLAVDGVLVALAYLLAYRLRFDGGIPDRYADLLGATLLPVVLAALAVFVATGLYQRAVRFFGYRDAIVLARGVVLATLAWVLYVALVHPAEIVARGGRIVAVSPPAGVIALSLLLMLGLLGGWRVLARALFERPAFAPRPGGRAVLIVGAGDGGRLVLREMLRNPGLGLRPVAFLDDDPAKRGQRIEGVRVLGDTRDDLPRALDEARPDEVVIAIPSAPGTLRARVVSACRARGVPVRTLPTVFELLQTTGPRAIRQIRPVQVEDVLGREPVRMEVERDGAYLAGETVLVTGAGGSIGAELCRQIARVLPRRLVLLDHAEDNLFAIFRELVEDRHVTGVEAILADCKEEERMREVLAQVRPTVVFHAAAYKHVGLTEANPLEAVRNNALATRLMARVAGEHRVKQFVLVSTDKAVAPATVMGASKALAEWAVEAAAARYEQTRYASVRFGNVLGSSGSVVPIFRRQIATGGPVTVTDPRMTRYFMTIPEAVQLVIRAGSLAQAGEVLVLDMGEPVRILDLARDMIRLSGFEPDRDIAIEIVGRRPGEKLHEEVANDWERLEPTGAAKVRRAARPPLDPAWVEETFDRVNLLVLEGDAAGLVAMVADLSSARALGAGPPVDGARTPPGRRASTA
jgi:FlaA1/EpsC-like NDP-sugar epimerase